jgi:hypothetical protein
MTSRRGFLKSMVAGAAGGLALDKVLEWAVPTPTATPFVRSRLRWRRSVISSPNNFMDGFEQIEICWADHPGWSFTISLAAAQDICEVHGIKPQDELAAIAIDQLELDLQTQFNRCLVGKLPYEQLPRRRLTDSEKAQVRLLMATVLGYRGEPHTIPYCQVVLDYDAAGHNLILAQCLLEAPGINPLHVTRALKLEDGRLLVVLRKDATNVAPVQGPVRLDPNFYHEDAPEILGTKPLGYTQNQLTSRMIDAKDWAIVGTDWY